MVKNGRDTLLGHETLKYVVSQDWIGVKSWFFACWYKFSKAKNYFNNYWVAMVKNGWDLLDHETLKSSIFPNDLMNWVDWLNDI